jgi:metal-responsive CopG/Arc/MetJ family transcriptional regulator
MKTIQMTLDEDLVKTVDQVVRILHTTRSAFTRNALRQAIHDMNVRQLEEKHRMGYNKKPEAHGEFDVWESEQIWGDE